MLNVYEQVDANKRKSVLVIILFVLFVVAVAWIFGEALGYGLSFVGWALIFSGLMSWGSYYYSDKIILTLSGARPADRKRDFLFTLLPKIWPWSLIYLNPDYTLSTIPP